MRLLDLRNLVLDAYGPRCATCGYDADRRALQLDHVNGGGNKERRNGGYWPMLAKALRDMDSGAYQILCANCNVIKRYEAGELGGRKPLRQELDVQVIHRR